MPQSFNRRLRRSSERYGQMSNESYRSRVNRLGGAGGGARSDGVSSALVDAAGSAIRVQPMEAPATNASPTTCVGPGVFESLSVVIPAYNAEREVAATLDSVHAYLQEHGLVFEIIVVDDGSGDRTASCVSACPHEIKLLQNKCNRGKGYSVRRGMLAAKHAWVLFMDVDNSTSIDHLDRFAPYAAESDVLIASRRLSASNILRRQPRLRQILGKSFPYLVRTLALGDIQDTQCGFKVFRHDAAKDIFARQVSAGFCFDVEILLVARRLGYRIEEIAVNWSNPPGSTVRVGIDPVLMFLDLLRITWRHRKEKYRASQRAVYA